MKGRFIFLAAVLVVLGMMGSANAASIIFSDDFNRGDNQDVNSGWVETENDSGWDVSVKNSQAMLRDKYASLTQTLSFSGFQNVTLDFDWKPAMSADATDFLSLSWDQGGNNWTTLWSTNLGGSGWTSESLTAGALDNLSNVRIKFATSVNLPKEKAWLDNVVVRGTPIPNPEPGTVALLGIGIVGLAGAEVRRRRKKKAVDNS